MDQEPAKCLTIGGSDSGGAAGIQADLKTWTVLGVYGMSAITAVTAQNSLAVTAVHFLPPDFLAAQITAVLSDYGAQAIKTGFIGQAALIDAVAEGLQDYAQALLVVDPVLVNHRGEPMFPAAVTEAYQRRLLPLATLITPNQYEAALLAGLPPEDLLQEEGLRSAVHRLHAYGAAQVLVTGLPWQGQIADFWSDGRHAMVLAHPTIASANRHGSGDALSAALCAFLARGIPLARAIPRAQAFVAQALDTAATWRLGGGHGPLALFPPCPDRSPDGSADAP